MGWRAGGERTYWGNGVTSFEWTKKNQNAVKQLVWDGESACMSRFWWNLHVFVHFLVFELKAVACEIPGIGVGSSVQCSRR